MGIWRGGGLGRSYFGRRKWRPIAGDGEDFVVTGDGDGVNCAQSMALQ
jgi:hypothetical protein